MTFEDLYLMPELLRAIEDKNYKKPTSIQEKAIPIILDGNDVLGCAQTGTGKTAAFALPIIQILEQINSKKKNASHRTPIQALIITPTRELALQIDENFEMYNKYTHLRHTVIFGGVKQGQQVQQLKKGINVLTATPGRLLDLINQGFIRLNDIEIFVLDEADRMLDMGFINDINKILALLPKERQSLFFSATMPDNIVKLSRKILDHPEKIEAHRVSSTVDSISQELYYTNKDKKKSLLIYLLERSDADQVLLFSRTKHGADRIARDLKRKQIKAAALHGDKAQNQRQRVLGDFKNGKIRVLVATDIAARGIDIDSLSCVINYDVPNVAETYVHRIGRSGRAGKEGMAISICEPEENQYIRDIEKLINKKLFVKKDHPFPQTDKPMTAAQKKEANKEKQRRKQEFFANRKKGRR